MLNIHTALLDNCDQDEFWLMCHIAKRVGQSMEAFPSNKTLCSDTHWGLNKLQIVKKRCIERGLILCQTRMEEKGQTSNIYKINTDYLGVYVNLKGRGGKEADTPPTRNSDTPPTRNSGNEVLSNEVLSNEVLTSEHNSAATAAHDGETSNEKKETKAERIDRESLEALNHLNTLCRRDFQPTPENLKFPRGRLQGGASLDTLKLIVEWAAATWKGQMWGNKRAEFYWRPATLFQAEKFDHYRQQAEIWKQGQNGKNGAASTGDIKAMRASGIYNQKQ